MLGILQVVQWIRIAIRTTNMKEICLSANRQDQEVGFVYVAVFSFYRLAGEISRIDLGHPHNDILVVKQDIAKIERGVLRRQTSCRYLIEQRLKLLIIILVYQCDSKASIGC